MCFGSLSSVNPLECISMKNQECKVRPEIVNISRNNPIFYPFSIMTNKLSSNCNEIVMLILAVIILYFTFLVL